MSANLVDLRTLTLHDEHSTVFIVYLAMQKTSPPKNQLTSLAKLRLRAIDLPRERSRACSCKLSGRICRLRWGGGTDSLTMLLESFFARVRLHSTPHWPRSTGRAVTGSGWRSCIPTSRSSSQPRTPCWSNGSTSCRTRFGIPAWGCGSWKSSF